MTNSAHSVVKLHPLFSDGAVLQQAALIPIWGTAPPHEKITVRFSGQVASTQADADGQWIVKLGPFQASSQGLSLWIEGKNRLEIKDVVVGEVWMCSGQSNMAFPLKQAIGGADVAQVADPLIRAANTLGEWVASSPQTSPAFSAVAFFFARALRRDLKVPVGLFMSAAGGTPAEMWMPRDAIQNSGARRVIVGQTSVQIGDPTQLTEKSGSLYAKSIKPYQPYAIRGVLWYQGETNQNVGYDYRKTFPALIQSWRRDWEQGNFPFLFVQLASFENERNHHFVDVRDSQFWTLKNVANTAMVVSFDKSTPDDVHPPDKKPIGERLWLAARALAYGEKDLVYSGPLFKSAEVQNGQIVVSFDSVGQGLETRGEVLKDFLIAGDDGKFVPAEAEIVGDTVLVSSPQIIFPRWVRYGWSNTPSGNLWNRDGLPASPFRSDELEIETQNTASH